MLLSVHPSSQSWSLPAACGHWAFQGLAPPALHFAPKVFNFISSRASSGLEKTISSFKLGLRHLGLPLQSQREEKRKQLSLLFPFTL